MDRADLRDLGDYGGRFAGCSFDRAKLTHAHLSGTYEHCTFRNAGLGRVTPDVADRLRDLIGALAR